MRKTSWLIRIWEKHGIIDLWSVNHTLAGVLFGFMIYFFNFDFLRGLLISIILMLVWEIFEITHLIKESIGNKALDLVLGMIALIAFYFILKSSSVAAALVMFIVVLLVFTILELWGFAAYLKRKKPRHYKH